MIWISIKVEQVSEKNSKKKKERDETAKI